MRFTVVLCLFVAIVSSLVLFNTRAHAQDQAEERIVEPEYAAARAVEQFERISRTKAEIVDSAAHLVYAPDSGASLERGALDLKPADYLVLITGERIRKAQEIYFTSQSPLAEGVLDAINEVYQEEKARRIEELLPLPTTAELEQGAGLAEGTLERACRATTVYEHGIIGRVRVNRETGQPTRITTFRFPVAKPKSFPMEPEEALSTLEETGARSAGQPRLVEMEPFHFAWQCETEGQRHYIDTRTATRLREADMVEWEREVRATEAATSGPESGGANGNLAPVFMEQHMQKSTDKYGTYLARQCGPTALAMVFDYWGEYVDPKEVSDVAAQRMWNASSGSMWSSTSQYGALERATMFSENSTAWWDHYQEQMDGSDFDPTGPGYSARPYGYSSCRGTFWDAMSTACMAADLLAFFDELDADENGSLTLSEAKLKQPGLTTERFNDMDLPPDDQVLTQQELQAAAAPGCDDPDDESWLALKGMIDADCPFVACIMWTAPTCPSAGASGHYVVVVGYYDLYQLQLVCIVERTDPDFNYTDQDTRLWDDFKCRWAQAWQVAIVARPLPVELSIEEDAGTYEVSATVRTCHVHPLAAESHNWGGVNRGVALCGESNGVPDAQKGPKVEVFFPEDKLTLTGNPKVQEFTEAMDPGYRTQSFTWTFTVNAGETIGGAEFRVEVEGWACDYRATHHVPQGLLTAAMLSSSQDNLLGLSHVKGGDFPDPSTLGASYTIWVNDFADNKEEMTVTEKDGNVLTVTRADPPKYHQANSHVECSSKGVGIGVPQADKLFGWGVLRIDEHLFEVKDSSGNTVAAIGDQGNVYVSSLTESDVGLTDDPAVNEFLIKNAAGNTEARIDDSGSVSLVGSRHAGMDDLHDSCQPRFGTVLTTPVLLGGFFPSYTYGVYVDCLTSDTAFPYVSPYLDTDASFRAWIGNAIVTVSSAIPTGTLDQPYRCYWQFEFYVPGTVAVGDRVELWTLRSLAAAIQAADSEITLSNSGGIIPGIIPVKFLDEQFHVEMTSGQQREVVLVTEASGDVLTITRGKMDTEPQAFPAGAEVTLLYPTEAYFLGNPKFYDFSKEPSAFKVKNASGEVVAYIDDEGHLRHKGNLVDGLPCWN